MIPALDRDTTYEHNGSAITLRAARYRNSCLAETPLVDDGIVDEIAVERFARGDLSVRLSPRELVCAVARLAFAGRNDYEIAERFGRPGRDGADWVHHLRARNRIASPLAPTLRVKAAA